MGGRVREAIDEDELKFLPVLLADAITPCLPASIIQHLLSAFEVVGARVPAYPHADAVHVLALRLRYLLSRTLVISVTRFTGENEQHDRHRTRGSG